MKVHITITGTQCIDGERDTVTQTAQGLLTMLGRTARIHYTERDDDGVATAVTVHASKDEVLVERRGPAQSQLRMRPGERCRSEYGTPYGHFEVTTHTHALSCALNEQGGRLYLAYTLDFGGTMENTLTMTIEPTKGTTIS